MLVYLLSTAIKIGILAINLTVEYSIYCDGLNKCRMARTNASEPKLERMQRWA